MTNHPNRSKFRHPAQRPDPATIEAYRKSQRMSRKEAADVVYGTESTWKSWEEGHRPMHAGLWELFKVKTLDREVLRALGLQRSSVDAKVATSSSPGFTLSGVMVSEDKP